MFLGFFILKSSKSEALLLLLAWAKLIVSSTTLSLKLQNQFSLRASQNFFTNRAVPLLFKCNLLLFKHESSILLSFMNIIHLALHTFSSFLLISLISSSNSWSWRWMTPEKAIYTSLTSISLMIVMPFLTFWSVSTLFWMSLVLVWMMIITTAWKVSVFGIILVRIFPHSDQNNSE